MVCGTEIFVSRPSTHLSRPKKSKDQPIKILQTLTMKTGRYQIHLLNTNQTRSDFRTPLCDESGKVETAEQWTAGNTSAWVAAVRGVQGSAESVGGGHVFLETTYRLPTPCRVCHQMLRGGRGKI